MKPRIHSARCLATLVLFVSGPASQAVTRYWDPNGTSTGAAAVTGAWNGTNNFWNTAAGGGTGTFIANPTAADDLIFSSAANLTTGTVTASGAGRLASSITFDDNIVITLAGPVTVGGTGTKSGIFASMGKSTASTVSGVVTLATAATIQSGNGPLTSSGGISLGVNNLSIEVAGTGRIQISGPITGSGAVAVSGLSTGDYVPPALSTYTGGTSLNAGSITAANSILTGTPGSPDDGPFGAGATPLILNGGQLRSGNGAAAMIGNTVTLAADTTFYTVASEKSLGFAGPVTLTGNRTLTSTVGTTVAGISVIFEGAIGDGGSGFGITKNGAGNLTFNGTNTYTGVTNINAGTLSIATTGSLPGWNSPGSFSVASGATLTASNAVSSAELTAMTATNNFATGSFLNLDTAAGNRDASDLTGAFNLTKTGTNTLALSGTNTYSGTTTITAGNLAIASAAALPGFDTNGRYSFSSGTSLIIQNGVSESEVTTILGTTNLANGAILGFDTSAGNRSYGTAIANTAQGALNLTHFGPNTLTFTGTNSYTGTTTLSGGTLVAAGGSATTGAIVVGNTTSGSVLNVPTGGTVTGSSLTAGNTAGSFGALNITGGDVNLTNVGDPDNIAFGGGNGGYGAFTMSSGSFTQTRFMFGGIGTATTVGGVGVGHISGGTVNSSGWIILARHGASTGVLTVTGGTLNHANANQVIAIGLQGSGRAELNVAGGLVNNSGQNVRFSGGTAGGFHWTGTGLLNLTGGTLLTNAIAYDTTTSPFSPNANSYVNLSGGTLMASSSSASFLPAHTPSGTGISQVLVNGPFGSFAGGAVIHTNGFNNTISADLLAPTGNGVTGLTIGSGGSGYIGAPAVRILDDGFPTTATAYAVVGTDPEDALNFGKVTSVVITNPGVIAGAASVELVGGGGSGATVSVSSTAPNTSGGLTKTGAGILTLSGTNTYTGPTSVTEGGLSVTAASALANSNGLSVSSGAGFNFLPAAPATLTLGASGTLDLASGSTIGTTFGSTIDAPGTASTSGTVDLALSGAFVSGTPYTVLSASGGLNGATYNILNPTDFTFVKSVTATSVEVTPTDATPLSAAYWVGGLSSNPGVWSASDGSTASNWASDNTGTPTPLVPGAAANVVFSATTALAGDQLNMSLGSSMTLNGISFNSPNPVSLLKVGASTLTLGANGLTVDASAGSVGLSPDIFLGSPQTWTNNSGSVLTLAGTVGNGSNLLTIGGTGATSIANFIGGNGGLQVSTGTTSIDAATLTAVQTWTNDSPSVLTTGDITNGGFAFTLSGTGNSAIDGVISGGGAFIKAGTGTATLSAANTYTGVTTLTNGTTTLTGNRTTSSGTLTVGSGANNVILNIQGDLPVVTGNNFIGSGAGGSTNVNQTAGNVSFGAATVLHFGSASTLGVPNIANYTLSGGTLGGNTTTGLVSLGVNSYSENTFTLSSSGILNLPAGGLHVGRSGRSDVTLTNNFYNQNGGTATVGNLIVGGNSNTAGGSGVNGTMNLTGGTFTATSFPNFAAGQANSSTINIGGTADVTLPAFPTVRGTGSTAFLTFDSGTLRPSGPSATYISGVISVSIKSGGALFDVASGNDITVSAALLTDNVSLGGGLTKLGAGALTLSGANTYTGDNLVSAGTLGISTSENLGAPAADLLLDGGTLRVIGTTLTSMSGLGHAVTLTPGKDVSLDIATTANVFTGDQVLNQTTGGLNKLGTGTLVLDQNNTFTGPTTVNAGTLAVPVINNIGTAGPLGAGNATDAASNTASLVLNGGTLAYTGASLITDRGFTVNANSGLNFAAPDSTLIFSGYITGAGGLTLSGAGSPGNNALGGSTQSSFTFAGDNSGFTGNLTINHGGIRVTENDGLGSGTKIVTATFGSSGNARIELDGINGDITLPDTFTYRFSNSNVTSNGSLVNIAGNNTVAGLIEVTSGGGNFAATSVEGNLTITADITATNTNRGAVFRGASDGTASGVISNGTSANFTLEKGGTGTWVVSGENTFSGATTVSEGTLSVGTLNSVIDGTASSNLGAPTTLANGTIRLGGAGSMGTLATASGTLRYTGAGEITDRVLNLGGSTGGGGIEQAGSGLLKFTSPMTATGVGSKTLTLGGSTAGTGEIAGAIVDNSVTDITSVLKTGSGTWTLSGVNTYSGSTTVSAGTLSISSAVLADSAALNVTTATGILNLTHSDTDVVDSMFVNGSPVTSGTYGGSGSGAQNIVSYITGTGKIQVGSGNYASWAEDNGIPGEPAGEDFDYDGLSNLVEYALGLNPTQPNGSPGSLVDGVLSFTKGEDAIANGDVTFIIEDSLDLGIGDAWSPAVTQAAPNSDPTISYTLPTGEDSVFARLKVVQIP